MKVFSAGLTFVNVATMAGLLLGIVGGGLDGGFAGLALVLGLAAAIYAWIGTAPFSVRKRTVAVRPPTPLPKSEPPLIGDLPCVATLRFGQGTR